MEISQQLGFEAGQAIATLKQLEGAIGGVNRRLTSFNKLTAQSSSQNAARVFGNLSDTAKRAENSLKSVGTQFDRTGRQGKTAGDSISVSWQTLGRVIATQALIRGLNNAIQLFSSAADQAEEFQLTIARISNIADGPAGTIDALSASVRELSVELGRDLGEVAGAAFEALQNDLGSTTETISLLSGAVNNLALITGGNLTESVNSVSSVLKSFSLDVGEADNVVDDFFTAIDKGRITLTELQSSLGNVTPLAANLGVGFDEVAGSIAAITQSGVTASRAQTQLRNVLQRLIDPTKSLQEAFDQLGVSTGQELIQATGGLIPALERLAQVAEPGSQAFADFFGTIRGNLGALNLLANDGRIVNGILEDLANNAGDAARAAATIDDIDARRSQRAFADLNDTILGLGEGFQSIRTSFVETFNAIIPSADAAKDAIILVGSALTGALIGAAVPSAIAAFGALTTATFTLSGALALLASGPILFLATAAAGIAAIGLGLDAIIESNAEAIDNANDRITEATTNAAKALDDSNKEANANFKKRLDERLKDLQESNERIRSEFQALTGELTKQSQNVATRLRSNVERFGDSLDSIFDRVKSQIDSLDDSIRDSQDNIRQTARELADEQFEFQIRGLGADDQTSRRLARLRQEAVALSNELRNAVANGADPNSLQPVLDRLREIREDSASIALQAGDTARARRNEAQAQQLSQQVGRQIIADEQARIGLFKQQKTLASENLGIQEQTRDIVKDLTQQLAETVIDAQADGIISPQDEKDIEAARQQLLDAAGDFNVEFFGAFGEAGNLAKATGALEQAFSSANFDFASVRTQLQEVLDQGPFKILVDAEASRTGIDSVDTRLSNAGNIGGIDPVTGTLEQIKELRQIHAEFQRLETDISNSREVFRSNLAELPGLLERALNNSDLDLLGGIGEQSRQLSESVAEDLRHVQSVINDPNATKAQIEQAGRVIEAVQNRVRGAVEEGLANPGLGDLLEAAISTADQAQNAVVTIKNAKLALNGGSVAQITEHINDLMAALDLAAIEVNVTSTGIEELEQSSKNTETSLENVRQKAQTELPAAFDGAKTSAAGVGTAIDGINQPIDGVKRNIGSAIQQMAALQRQAAATLQTAAAAAAAGGSAQFANTGGKIKFRQGGGGFSRGSDTVLASLTPGEFVVNARQARNFAPQLQALNAGQSPQFRETGGSVTNVGDININMTTTSETSPGMVKDISRHLRRDVQRGITKLS